jgi:hypothetical protein
MTEAVKLNEFCELSNTEMHTVDGGSPITDVFKDIWTQLDPNLKVIVVPVVCTYLLYEAGKYVGKEIAKMVYFN